MLLGVLATVGASVPAAAQDAGLAQRAATLGQAWAAADVAGIGGMLHHDGVQLTLLGHAYGTVSPRQARAAIQEFLDDHAPRRAAVTRTSQVAPGRGFAEIRLETVAPGTSEVLTYTVFAGFAEGESGWLVSEVRVLE